MSTVTLTLVTKAFPSISNRIRASVASPLSPLALIASLYDTVSGHPQRTWSFFGLPRNNYTVSLDEVDGSDNVLTPIAKFDVTPGQLDGFIVRNDEQIKVDVTPGLVGGANTFTFDGTAGKPDYRGWEIVPSELNGRGIMQKGVDYSWNATTGTFTLLLAGDIFASGQPYNIHFNDQIYQAGQGVPTINDFKINRITGNTVLDSSYFGNKLLVEPAGDYIEVTFPDINTVVEGRYLDVEIDAASTCCVRFITQGGQTLNFLRGNLFALPKETFKVYKFIRPSGLQEYRVSSAEGNFKTVGQLVSYDQIQTGVYNAKLFDGSIELVTRYARVYNEVVLQLPTSQRCDFDSWTTGANKYLYSLANSTDPSNAGKFHFPNRLGLYERNNATGKAGDFLDQLIKEHDHIFPGDDSLQGWDQDSGLWIPVKAGAGTSRVGDLLSTGGLGHFLFFTSKTGGAETRPVSYLSNRYVLI